MDRGGKVARIARGSRTQSERGANRGGIGVVQQGPRERRDVGQPRPARAREVRQLVRGGRQPGQGEADDHEGQSVPRARVVILVENAFVCLCEKQLQRGCEMIKPQMWAEISGVSGGLLGDATDN